MKVTFLTLCLHHAVYVKFHHYLLQSKYKLEYNIFYCRFVALVVDPLLLHMCVKNSRLHFHKLGEISQINLGNKRNLLRHTLPFQVCWFGPFWATVEKDIVCRYTRLILK